MFRPDFSERDRLRDRRCILEGEEWSLYDPVRLGESSATLWRGDSLLSFLPPHRSSPVLAAELRLLNGDEAGDRRFNGNRKWGDSRKRFRCGEPGGLATSKKVLSNVSDGAEWRLGFDGNDNAEPVSAGSDDEGERIIVKILSDKVSDELSSGKLSTGCRFNRARLSDVIITTADKVTSLRDFLARSTERLEWELCTKEGTCLASALSRESDNSSGSTLKSGKDLEANE